MQNVGRSSPAYITPINLHEAFIALRAASPLAPLACRRQVSGGYDDRCQTWNVSLCDFEGEAPFLFPDLSLPLPFSFHCLPLLLLIIPWSPGFRTYPRSSAYTLQGLCERLLAKKNPPAVGISRPTLRNVTCPLSSRRTAPAVLPALLCLAPFSVAGSNLPSDYIFYQILVLIAAFYHSLYPHIPSPLSSLR
jgi:hypothetical protein